MSKGTWWSTSDIESLVRESADKITDSTADASRIIRSAVDKAVQAEKREYRELRQRFSDFIYRSEAEKVEMRQKIRDLERGRLELSKSLVSLRRKLDAISNPNGESEDTD